MPVTFTDVQRVLGLFADGVAGRSVPIEVVDDERSVWPWRSSSVADEVVRVPAVAADRGALRATVLHHTGFSEFGSFDDGHDDRERSMAASTLPGVVRRIYGMLEDRRIDAATRSRYPGARADLDRVLAQVRSAVPSEPPVDWREAILESLQLHSLGESRDVLLDRIGPGRRRALAAILDLVEPLDTPDDNARAALAIGRLLDGDDLDLEGDPTFAVTAGRRLDREGSIDPPDDRGSTARRPAPATVARHAPGGGGARPARTARRHRRRRSRGAVGHRRGQCAGPPAGDDDRTRPDRRPRRPDLLLRRVGPRRPAAPPGVVPRPRAAARRRRPDVPR